MNIEDGRDFDAALREAGLSQEEPYDERLDIHGLNVCITNKARRRIETAHTSARKLLLPYGFPLCTTYMFLSRCNRENAPKMMAKLLGSSKLVFCYELYDSVGFGEKGEYRYAHDYLKFIAYHRFRLLWWSVRKDRQQVAFLYSL